MSLAHRQTRQSLLPLRFQKNGVCPARCAARSTLKCWPWTLAATRAVGITLSPPYQIASPSPGENSGEDGQQTAARLLLLQLQFNNPQPDIWSGEKGPWYSVVVVMVVTLGRCVRCSANVNILTSCSVVQLQLHSQSVRQTENNSNFLTSPGWCWNAAYRFVLERPLVKSSDSWFTAMRNIRPDMGIRPDYSFALLLNFTWIKS